MYTYVLDNSIIDFRSNIITHSDESYSTVTPSISNNEQFLWRNVVDISNQEGGTCTNDAAKMSDAISIREL